MNKLNVIFTFVKDQLLDDHKVEISKETSLFQERLLDSLNLLNLIGFLENKFSIKIHPAEITPANIDTIHNITAFIDQKLKANE
jgi:acyl carrier protein